MVSFPNFRKVDNKFCLSGGWNNLPENVKFLQANNIKAVLDLQFLPDDSVYSASQQEAMILYIRDELEKVGIRYKIVKMRDDEFNLDLEYAFTEGSLFLIDAEEDFADKGDKILVKCAAGISRSPSMLINYLCASRRISYLEALQYVRENEEKYGVWFGASPNMFFAEHLKNKYK